MQSVLARHVYPVGRGANVGAKVPCRGDSGGLESKAVSRNVARSDAAINCYTQTNVPGNGAPAQTTCPPMPLSVPLARWARPASNSWLTTQARLPSDTGRPCPFRGYNQTAMRSRPRSRFRTRRARSSSAICPAVSFPDGVQTGLEAERGRSDPCIRIIVGVARIVSGRRAAHRAAGRGRSEGS